MPKRTPARPSRRIKPQTLNRGPGGQRHKTHHRKVTHVPRAYSTDNPKMYHKRGGAETNVRYYFDRKVVPKQLGLPKAAMSSGPGGQKHTRHGPTNYRTAIEASIRAQLGTYDPNSSYRYHDDGTYTKIDKKDYGLGEL